MINSGKLTQEVMRFENDPEVKKLAQKYKDPEARKALFTDGRPDLAVIKDKTILAKG